MARNELLTRGPLAAIWRSDQVDRVVDRFRPTGWTPIAGALDAARAEFAGVDPEADNRVILVSDGIETCDGDPVAAARRLDRADVSVTVDVVGFDVDAAAARQLERVARVTGGTYTDARSAGQLRSYFDRQYDRFRSLERELNCVAQHRKDVADCYVVAGRAAADGYVLDRFRATAPDDAEQRDAYLDVIAAVAAGTRRRSGAVREIADARIEELSAQVEVARERWERRYRRTLRYDCFAGDVTLVVDGVDYSARWGWVPVLDFALGLDDLVDALTSGDGVEVFEFTESEATLTFRRTGTDVTVAASWRPGSAVAPYADLRAATKAFLARVLSDLVTLYPPLAQNPVLVERFGDLTGS